jgi:VIT1/CCC1 family predicted Fe2+/Mn2+ transporter
MPIRHTHTEYHASSPATVRDIVIGMSDGLTVPFALAAGLSGATTATKLVILAGIAEIAAGSVAMGLGGYLAARTDEEHYHSELQREIDETRELPEEEMAEVRRVFQGWGLTDQQIEPIVTVISSDEKRWVDFMMKFELNLEEPDPKRALYSAATIAASYVVGGFIPLSPYMLSGSVEEGLWWSVGVTIIALFGFGYLKGRFTGINPLKGAAQTTFIGGLAAATAFGLARAFR